MTDIYQVLEAIIRAVHATQSDLDSVTDAAYAASFKDTLAQQMNEFDSIESEILTAAARRGWELSEFNRLSDSAAQARLRFSLHFGCTDSRIAERMIRRHTDSMNRSLKLLHRCGPIDGHIHTLFQKLMDCQRACIRQLQQYL